MKKELVRALGNVEFEEHELAYLALTSKPELHFRDRLAWQLDKDVGTKGFGVAREWRRIDLAVLDENGDPQALVQAKAFGSFNKEKTMRQREAKLSEDLDKASEKGPEAELFALLVVTHARRPLSTESTPGVSSSTSRGCAPPRIGRRSRASSRRSSSVLRPRVTRGLTGVPSASLPASRSGSGDRS
jgi:hypothetical protein